MTGNLLWPEYSAPTDVAAIEAEQRTFAELLDALPLTDLGKPYKPALRADATRRELTEALAGVPGVLDVEAEIDDGAVVAVVRTTGDDSAIKAILGRYPIGWRLVGAS